MKHLKSYKLFEDITGWSTTDKFEERDLTDNDTYTEIKNEFGISSEELGFILLEFIDEYNLKYKCMFCYDTGEDINKKAVIVNFYPNNENTHIAWMRDWIESKIGSGHNWDWEMLSEMDNRLSDHVLTIKQDGIYQLFLHSSLKLVISKSE